MSDWSPFEKNLRWLQARELLSPGSTEPSLHSLVNAARETGLPMEHLLYRDLERRRDIASRDLRMLVMDCDGVLTDGAMIFSKNGDEIKQFNAKDGLGIRRLQKAGWTTGIISAGVSSGLVERRAAMLDIDQVYVGKKPKIEILDEWLRSAGLRYEQIAYIGDDLSDMPILERAGASFCPADAVPAVRRSVEVVLSQMGGRGCVREMIDSYLMPAVD